MTDAISELLDYESCERAFVSSGEAKHRTRLHASHQGARSALESREHLLRVEAAGRHTLIILFRRSMHALLVWEEESMARIELQSEECGSRATLRRLHELQWVQGAAHAPLFAEETASRLLIAKARQSAEFEWRAMALQLREEHLRETLHRENVRLRCGLSIAWVATLRLDTIADDEEKERSALAFQLLSSLRTVALSAREWLAHAKEAFQVARTAVVRDEDSARQAIAGTWRDASDALRLDELIQRHLCALVALFAHEMALRELRRREFRTTRARMQLAESESHWRRRIQDDEAEVAQAHAAWHGAWLARYRASRAVGDLEFVGRSDIESVESSERWSAKLSELQHREEVHRALVLLAPWEALHARLFRREAAERQRLQLVLEQEPKARRSCVNLERMWWLKCITSKSAMLWRVTRIEHTQADGRRQIEKEHLDAYDALERLYLYSTSAFADEQLLKYKRVMYQRNRQDRRRLVEHEEVPRQRVERLQREERVQVEQLRFFGVETLERRLVDRLEVDERAYLKKRIEGRVTAMVTTSVVVFAEPVQRVLLEEWQGRQFHVLRQAWWFMTHLRLLIWNTCLTEMWESRVFYLREEARSRLLLEEHAMRSVLRRQLMTEYIAVGSHAFLEQWLGFHSVGATAIAKDERLGRCVCVESYQRARLRRLEVCERVGGAEQQHRVSLLVWEARGRFRLKEALARSLVIAEYLPARMHMMTHLVAPQEHLERDLVALQQAERWQVLWREAERSAFVSGALTRLRATRRDEGEERIQIEVRRCRANVSHDEAQARSLLPEAHVRVRIQLQESVARSVLAEWYVEVVTEPQGRERCEREEHSSRQAAYDEIRVVQVHMDFHCVELAARHEVERQEQEERELHHLSRLVDRSLKRHGSRRRSLDEIVSAARELFPSAAADSELPHPRRNSSSSGSPVHRRSSAASATGSVVSAGERTDEAQQLGFSGEQGSGGSTFATHAATAGGGGGPEPESEAAAEWSVNHADSGGSSVGVQHNNYNRRGSDGAASTAMPPTTEGVLSFFLFRCVLPEPLASEIDDSEFLARTRMQQHEALLWEQLCAYARDDVPSTNWGLPTPLSPGAAPRGRSGGASILGAFQRRFSDSLHGGVPPLSPPPPPSSSAASAIHLLATPPSRPQWTASPQKTLTPVAPLQTLLSPERRASSARRPQISLPLPALVL